MTIFNQAQIFFFRQIKERLPDHVSLVDEVADLLEIGNDSAYRRIRGEKELSFSELQVLISKFHVSADLALNTTSENEIVFGYRALDEENFPLKDYVESAYKTLSLLSTKENCEIIYSARDIPLFHYFDFDEIAIFKLFVWQKTLLGFPKFENRRFSFDERDNELLETGRKLMREYNKVTSHELWHEEVLTSILRQIEFYFEAGQFKNREDALTLLDKVDDYLVHIKAQAAEGVKFVPGEKANQGNGKYFLYINEVVLSDNTVLARTADKMATFITHNAINFLTTYNEHFCNTTNEWFKNLMKKGSLISGVSEKQREQFFGILHTKVDRTRGRLKQSD